MGFPARPVASRPVPEPLHYELRPAAFAEPAGALVLCHGRGVDERDLLPLLDVLDPKRRLVGAAPRAPLQLPPGGRHWYAVARVGYPDADGFWASFELLSEFLDALAERTGVPIGDTVLGGFSQGAVMTYALGLAASRPRPAGLIALSGFVPTVEGFELDLSPPFPPIAIGHGTFDPVISVEWGRRARQQLEQAGADVLFREYPLPHAIDPRYLSELASWLAGVLPERIRASTAE
jgi:phospholipase/carboxylesterase